MGDTRRPGNDMNNDNFRKKQAEEDAYNEYMSLREHRSSRGNYVKDDTLYGSYIPNSSSEQHHSSETPTGGGIENTPYGSSEMRKKRLEQEEYERYLRERGEEPKGGRKKPIAKNGSVNKADKPSKAEKKQMKKDRKKKGKKSGRGLKIALIVLLVLVLGIGGVIAAGLTVVKNTLDNVGRVELDPDMIGIDPKVDSDLRNYRNIALLGIDARDMSDDSDVRSDAIIVASINKETNEIKMFSVYRDTMVDLGEGTPGLDKITHGYYYGGPTKMLYGLNKNLDLNIKEVVVVNWKSVADGVDALGGLDIDIQESEINEMNKYIKDTQHNIGGSRKLIDHAGKQTLNGNQAVTYARIRKDSSQGDYRRNERMKIVVKEAFKKAATMSPKELKKISEDILPEIKTNMSSADMMSMVLKLNSYEMTDSVGWPYTVGSWSNNGWYGPPVTLSSNVTQLHEEFFNQQDYVPTQAVQNISQAISSKTGLY